MIIIYDIVNYIDRERVMKFWIKMIAGLVMGIIIGTYIEPGSLSLEPLRVIGMLFFKLLNFVLLFGLCFYGVKKYLLPGLKEQLANSIAYLNGLRSSHRYS